MDEFNDSQARQTGVLKRKKTHLCPALVLGDGGVERDARDAAAAQRQIRRLCGRRRLPGRPQRARRRVRRGRGRLEGCVAPPLRLARAILRLPQHHRLPAALRFTLRPCIMTVVPLFIIEDLKTGFIILIKELLSHLEVI